MAHSQKTKSSRRGFLQSFLSGFTPTKRQLTPEEIMNSKQASILALKYAKNQARLSKIGVESPEPLSEGLFLVKIFGLNVSGKKINMTLEVNPEAKDVAIRNVERDDASGDADDS